MKVGDQVQKLHLCDGTDYAGKPHGPILTIIKIEDHRPIDGPTRKDSVIWLSDNTWEFPWNLERR